ncbi:hypothetical protein TURU_037322 [Turdus rufiventris]|nr:hypothetical protein TURU_037322 [Turdus rufiventris]
MQGNSAVSANKLLSSSPPALLLEPVFKVQNLISSINRADDWGYKHHKVTPGQKSSCPSINVFPELRSPELNTACEVWPHIDCPVQGDNHCPGPAGHTVLVQARMPLVFSGVVWPAGAGRSLVLGTDADIIIENEERTVLIFVNERDNGIKYTLDRFADDMKPSGEDEEQKNGAIQWNLCKLKKWACMNSCSLVQVGIENSPAKEDLGPLMDEKLDMSQQCALQPKSPPWLHPKHRGQWGTPPAVLHSALGSPAQKGHRTAGDSPEEGHKDEQSGAALL